VDIGDVKEGEGIADQRMCEEEDEVIHD